MREGGRRGLTTPGGDYPKLCGRWEKRVEMSLASMCAQGSGAGGVRTSVCAADLG